MVLQSNIIAEPVVPLHSLTHDLQNEIATQYNV